MEAPKQTEESPTVPRLANNEWPYNSWPEAVNVFTNGDEASSLQFPVIIDGTSGPFGSAEQPQQVANLSTVPAVETTTVMDRMGNDQGERVHVALVN